MKVIIVDDHPLVRQGLSSVLGTQEDIELIGECSNVISAIRLIYELKPDIAIVDLMLGKESGLDIVVEVRKSNLDIKFIILTSSASYENFIQAEKIGVEGYVLKEALPDEFLYAIRLIYRGRKYYDPELIELKREQEESAYNEQLTEREIEVLKELSYGLNNKQIANKLYITENTVKKHVSQILAKLNLNDRTQAAIYVTNSKIKNIV